MHKYFIILLLLIGTVLAKAHQPDLSSTMLIEQGKNQWLLQVRAALTAFEYEIESNYGKDAYSTPEEFRDLVIDHVKKHVSVEFNQLAAVAIQNAYVKLGHETNVVFELTDVPKLINSVRVKNNCFEDINRNQSALIILKEGMAQDQFVLDQSNDHTTTLQVAHSKFVKVTNATMLSDAKYMYYMVFVLITSIIFASVLLVFKKEIHKNLARIKVLNR